MSDDLDARIEEALGFCSVALAAISGAEEHYGFGDLTFRFEDREPMTLRQLLDRTLALVRPVHEALEARNGAAASPSSGVDVICGMNRDESR